MTTTVTEAPPLTPYDLAGGAERVRAFVERFYDLMDADPAYAELRALHAPDLGPMRASLAGFLSAWLGGPRDWFEQRPGVCMMSAHGKVRIDAKTARQWTEAMARALADSGIDPALTERINEAFARMAQGMAAR
jgi:hemoglobin